MNPRLKNVLAVIAGILIGGLVNSAIVGISGKVIPPPAGTDMTTPEGIKAAIPLMQPVHFLMPFLAHALGTLVGALVATLLTASNKLRIALGIGVFFLIGGIAACFMIPAPAWFMAVDLLLAYIPMAYLGARLGGAGKA